MCKCVERQRIIAKVGYVENGLSERQIKPRKICIKSGIWRSKVRNAGGGADACTGLFERVTSVSPLLCAAGETLP